MPVIEIRYLKKEGNHTFEFKDNGIGIAPQFQNKIFEMFKRLNSRDVYQGSGLGLSIVKKLIENINGEVSVLHTEENEGSTFKISFPQIEIDNKKESPAELEFSKT